MQNAKDDTKDALITEINIGVVGHVDHGKTSLVQALTGVWASRYAEELKRGITIRLGYADTVFYQCHNDKWWGITSKCQKCFGDTKPMRAVSFIDAPGHETLMATVLSGAALMDGALLVISAHEHCPQPQTAEHLKALDISGIKKIIIVQNKIDIVSEERAKESYDEIRDFAQGTVAEGAPVIPISALHNTNIDMLIQTIQEYIPTPQRDASKEPHFLIARSFDINKPGTPIEKLRGGVIGGSLTQGILKSGQAIEIAPGPKIKENFKPIETTITEVVHSKKSCDQAQPGGLVAIQTLLDPALTRGDLMAGNVAGLPGKLPKCTNLLRFEPHLFDYVIGIEGKQKVTPIRQNDALLMTVAISRSVGIVISSSSKESTIKLKIPICAETGTKVAIARQVANRWHLIGWGITK
jgi:translation initiation factor 2 subunit 3